MKDLLVSGFLMLLTGCPVADGTPRQSSEKSLDERGPQSQARESPNGGPSAETNQLEAVSTTDWRCVESARLPIDPGIVAVVRANPAAMAGIFGAFLQDAPAAIPPAFSQLSDAELCALYSAGIAYSMAPYGNSTSLTLDGLLADAALDCDNYALLTHHLFLLAQQDNPPEDVTFQLVGWNGGAVGNHAQLFVNTPQRSLLLDPTIGVVAICDFDSVASGEPVAASRILKFSTRPQLEGYRKRVVNALIGGRYKPSDLLYYFEDVEQYKRMANNSGQWPTPGAVTLRKHIRTQR